MSTQNLCFEHKYEKYQNFSLKLSVFVVKFSIYLNRRVFVMLGRNSGKSTKCVQFPKKKITGH